MGKVITGKFNWRMPQVVPSFAEGEDAKALFDEVSKTIKSGVWYDADSKTMKGSSAFLAARVDSILRPKGIRVTTLADLSRPEIMQMIKGDYYSDTPAIVFRTMEDRYKPNVALIKKLAPKIEELNGKLKLLVLVTGFDVVPSKDKSGYGLEIVPRNDFAALHDERLSGKYDGKRFSIVDEQGLPNFDENGSRTWYARNEGLSWLYLNRNLNLDSGCCGGYLAASSEAGRVVLVRDVADKK